MPTSIDFYATFPELSEIPTSLVEVMLLRVTVTTNSFSGLATSEAQKLAILLQTAHNLSKINPLENSKTTTIPPFRKIASKNDTIEFQPLTGSAFDLETSIYGRELLDLITCNPTRFFLQHPEETVSLQII